MYRYLYNNLREWKTAEGRKPLVLFGARQVGKTWLLKEFGKNEYLKTAYISFDRDDAACQLMKNEKSALKLIRGLSALTGVDITPNDTFVILFGAMKKGARASEFEEAIQWLADAGIVYRINHVTTVQMPLKFYEERGIQTFSP